VKAESAAAGKLSIVTRDDGSKQLAYNGMPLYYFAADKAAGDTNGSAIPNWAVANP
jgi:predicted lipoprotein with Yx(FWY)xxD motif